MKDSPRSGRPTSRTLTCVVVATFMELSPHKSVQKTIRGTWSTTFDADLCCGCHFHGTITTQVCSETIRGTWSTTFDHVWPQEGHGDEVVLGNVYNWSQQHWHEAMSQRMCFVFGIISGNRVSWESSLFRWMCSLLQLLILKCFLGRNRILVTCFRCKTTHHT